MSAPICRHCERFPRGPRSHYCRTCWRKVRQQHRKAQNARSHAARRADAETQRIEAALSQRQESPWERAQRIARGEAA